MPDVLLITLPKLDSKQFTPYIEYLGIGYIAAALDQSGISNQILDCYNYHFSLDQAVDIVRKMAPRVIGITAPFALELVMLVKMVKKLREQGFQGHIAVGGNAAVLCKEKVMSMCDINSLALGESEHTFPILVKQILNGSVDDSMEGYWFRKDGSIIQNQPSYPITDLDCITFPKRTNLFSGQPTVVDRRGKVATIVSSRGCPFRCKFCAIHSLHQDNKTKAWRWRSAENVVDEIEYLVQWGISEIRFADDNFMGNCQKGNERALMIAEEIIRRNLHIHFSIETRVDTVDKHLFSKLKMAGLQMVALGIESGVQRMLNSWRKDITVQQSEQAIEILNSLGIRCIPNFILYDMWSTVDEMETNYNFIKTNGLYRYPDALDLFTNILGVIANSEIEKEIGESRLQCWNFYSLSWEDQMLFDQLKILRYYKIIDAQMEQFIHYHSYWVRILKEKMNIIRHLSSISIESTHTIKIEKWGQRVGYLAIQLFKHVIDGVRDDSPQNLKEQLDQMIEEYDRKILGHSFFDNPMLSSFDNHPIQSSF